MKQIRPRRASTIQFSVTEDRKRRALEELSSVKEAPKRTHKSLRASDTVKDAILEALERYDGQKNMSYAKRQEIIKQAHDERLKIF